jgi:folate-binding protein YgfZ
VGYLANVSTCRSAAQPDLIACGNRCTTRTTLAGDPGSPNPSGGMQKLYHAETLLIAGPDAVTFAHAQFSSNVIALAVRQWQFSAWLDSLGRVRVFFHLVRLADDQLLLLLRGGNAASVVESLQRFVFRSRVKLTACEPRVLSTGPTMNLHTSLLEQEDLLLGCGTHSLCVSGTKVSGEVAANDSHHDNAWRILQLHAGWPWLPDALLSELLSPALSLQRLDAVVIDKGCYPGQEIVARMHFRGGNKKHLHRVALSQEKSSAPKSSGEILRIDAHEKGRLLDVLNNNSGIEALAVLNDDVVAQAVDGEIIFFDDGAVIHLCETWNA